MGFDSSSRARWTGVNTTLAIGATLTLGAAAEVFLFGVLWTHGVYGSRMAWLLGVVLPLLAITAGLAWGAARYGVEPGSGAEVGARREPDPLSPRGERDQRRNAAEGVGGLALVLICIPFAFAGLLLVTYGLLFVTHWLR